MLTNNTLQRFEKRRLWAIEYAILDYELASDVIIEKALARQSYAVFALPVHGLITAIQDQAMQQAVQKADMITPDGQPIRWALNSFYKVGLKDRVYGPLLTLKVLEKANPLGLRIYLYGGNTEETLQKFQAFIQKNFPNIQICGAFREEKPTDNLIDIEALKATRPHIVLVGRGCPTQEIWVASQKGNIPAVMMAVGAAFAFHAGTIAQAPIWMQKMGLEWLFRLIQEPKRLWKRYLTTNSYFIYLFIKHRFFLRRPY
ncbi:MAG: WecB/TagA/CpsF family glycosyltransferase [Microscillaceae bacterium]|nr:WecB/TagA/CpsF family glycosyltransferase [Microscillaceae bacterium]MDW8460350.1 WecB/TagA/CpsF family glycosyltransferase [Cytophagales bacterium]